MDDLRVVIVFLEPRDDDGRVQTARIGEDDLLEFFLCHDKNLHVLHCVILMHKSIAQIVRICKRKTQKNKKILHERAAEYKVVS